MGCAPLLTLLLATGARSPILSPNSACDKVYSVPLDLYPPAGSKTGITPDLKLRVVGHSLTFGSGVEGDLVLENQTGKPISGIGLLVAYEDAQGRPIFTLGYQASVKGSRPAAAMPGAFVRSVLTRAVQPGEAIDISAASPQATTVLPAKAEVSLLDLPGPRRLIIRTASNPYRSEPTLDEVPKGAPKLGSPARDLPGDALLKLRIDAQGYVEDVSYASDAVGTGALAGLAAEEMRRWRFYPATRDGYAVPYRLWTLLRFRRGDFPPARDCFIGQGDRYPRTFAVVTVETNPPGLPEGWQWFYGGVNVYGSIGPITGGWEFEITPYKMEGLRSSGSSFMLAAR